MWLSIGGRLIFKKSVLEAIVVFWHALDFITKGVLETIRKKCFKFLWYRKIENEEICLVKWKNIAKPKEEGGWGLKNIHFFGNSLAAKSLWRVIKSEGL
jgi:hypothetical protein